MVRFEKKNPSEKETFITQFCSKFMIKSRLIFLWGLFHFSNFQLKLKRHSSANKISRLLFLTVNWSILIINQSMKSFWYCKTFDLTKKNHVLKIKIQIYVPNSVEILSHTFFEKISWKQWFKELTKWLIWQKKLVTENFSFFHTALCTFFITWFHE